MVLKLFSNCIIVNGANRSLICDLQRTKFEIIPQSLASLFDENGILNMPKELEDEDIATIETYLSFLEQNEFVFSCRKKDLKQFPPLDMKWEFPSVITNIIVDVQTHSNHNYEKIIFESVESLNCYYIQFRCYDEMSLDFWAALISLINNSPIKAIDIILKDSPNQYTHKEFAEWVYGNRKVRCATLHSSEKDKLIQPENHGFSIVLAVKEIITSSAHCGVIHPIYFSINIPTYTESLSHNTCLNRKLAIDVDGNIKNCPSMKESFGNIRDISFFEAITKPDFKKYWSVTKDQITKCKDCEFRHICTDCRAYIDNPEDIYSAPLKCGYNPYSCEWEEWSINPLKQNVIDYYEMRKT